MSKKYYDIELQDIGPKRVDWILIEEDGEYFHPIIVAEGKAKNMFEAFKAASKERNKYVGENDL